MPSPPKGPTRGNQDVTTDFSQLAAPLGETKGDPASTFTNKVDTPNAPLQPSRQSPTRRAGMPVRSAVSRKRLGTYSLASLIMFMTLVCVVLGVSTLWRGLGIPSGIVAMLAFSRTAILIRRQETIGHEPHAAERAILFAGSMGAVILTGLAAWLAFWFSCSPIVEAGGGEGASSGLLLFALLFGLVVGLFVAYLLHKIFAYLLLKLLSNSERFAMRTGRGQLIWVTAIVLTAIVAITIFVGWWF